MQSHAAIWHAAWAGLGWARAGGKGRTISNTWTRVRVPGHVLVTISAGAGQPCPSACGAVARAHSSARAPSSPACGAKGAARGVRHGVGLAGIECSREDHSVQCAQVEGHAVAVHVHASGSCNARAQNAATRGDRTDWPLARGLAALAVGPQPGREVLRSSRRFDWGDSVWRTRLAWDSIASFPLSSMVVDAQHGALTPASRHARHGGAPSKPRIAKSWADVAVAAA